MEKFRCLTFYVIYGSYHTSHTLSLKAHMTPVSGAPVQVFVLFVFCVALDLLPSS